MTREEIEACRRIGRDEVNSQLANAGHGRDACGINHDELIHAATEELRADIARLTRENASLGAVATKWQAEVARLLGAIEKHREMYRNGFHPSKDADVILWRAIEEVK